MALLIAPRNAPVLARQAERILVEGCRAGIAGFETRCLDCWEVGWTFCAGEIGPRDARRLIGDIFGFVREVRSAAGRRIEMMPRGCQMLSRDECLLLAAVAAAQNGAPSLSEAAAGHFAGDSRGTVVAAAGDLAEAMQAVRQLLLPIPDHVVEDIATRPKTIHFH